MRNKKRIILVAVLIIILLLMFFFQKSLITDFSLEPERLELSFDLNSEILPLVLSEEQYITERYDIGYEYEKDNLDNYISIISIQKPIGAPDEFFKEKFIDYLRFKIPKLDEEELEIVDYSHTSRLLMEWHRGTKLFVASLLFILIAITLIRRIKVINKGAKKDLEIYYFREIFHLKTSEILEEAIKLALLIFSEIFLIQWIIRFQFNIPGKYLPPTDIFDFEFYRILNNPIKMNLSSYGYLYNITLSKVKLLTLGFFILGIITFLLIIRMINNKLQIEGSEFYGKSII